MSLDVTSSLALDNPIKDSGLNSPTFCLDLSDDLDAGTPSNHPLPSLLHSAWDTSPVRAGRELGTTTRDLGNTPAFRSCSLHPRQLLEQPSPSSLVVCPDPGNILEGPPRAHGRRTCSFHPGHFPSSAPIPATFQAQAPPC